MEAGVLQERSEGDARSYALSEGFPKARTLPCINILDKKIDLFVRFEGHMQLYLG